MTTERQQVTAQQVLDTVVQHLLTQNAKALNDEGYCQFHTDSGRKCAVGCLIPDDRYTPDIENACIIVHGERESANVVALHELLDELGLGESGTLQLLRDLQDVHDDEQVSQWKMELRHVAKNHNLKYNPPK